MLLIFAILLIVILVVLVRCIVIVPSPTPTSPSGSASIRTPGARACTSARRLLSASPAKSP